MFSVLALLYGAFGLWFFAERAVEAHYAGKPSRSLKISVWAISVSLFVACLGAVIDRRSQEWGNTLFLVGIDVLPLILLWSIQAYSRTTSAEEKKHKEAQLKKLQEIVMEEYH